MHATDSQAHRHPQTFIASQDERQELLAFAQVLNEIDARADAGRQAKLVSADGHSQPIPRELFPVLAQAAKALALGDGITILPYAARLTTQEAADFLGMSRPTLIKLLTEGEIPFETVGRHRRILLRDALDYQDRVRTKRRHALSELARETAARGTIEPAVPVLKRLSEFDRK